MTNHERDERQKFNWQKVILVLALTTLIFIVGVVFGNYIASKKINMINYMEQDLRTETTAVELQYLLLAEDPCIVVNSTPLTDELYDIATRLDYMENSLGEDDEDVLRLKNYYSTLQIRHWLIMKKMQKECNKNLTLVMYFYDTKKDCPKCEQQGFILTYLRKKFPDIYVYAFYIDLENAAINTIKSIYGISETPSIIIDDHKMEGFKNKDEIMELIECKDGCLEDET